MKSLHCQVLSAFLLVSVVAGAVEKEGAGLVTGTIYVDDTREKNCTDTDNRDGIPGDNEKDIIIVDSELDTNPGSTSTNVGGRNSINIGGRPSKIGSGSISSAPLLRPNTAGPLLEFLQGLQGNIASQPLITPAPQPNAGAVLEFLKGSGIFNQGGIQGNIATQPLITPGSLTINSAPQPNPGAVLEFLKGSGIFNQGGIQGNIATQPLVNPGQITISSAPQETSTSFVNTWNRPYEVVNEGSSVNRGSVSIASSGGQNGKYLEILPGQDSYEYHVISDNIGSYGNNVRIPNRASVSITSGRPREVISGGSNGNAASVSVTTSGGQTGKYLEIVPGEDSYEYEYVNDNIGSSGSNVRIPNRASISISSSGPRRVPVPDFDIGGRGSSVITTEQIPRRTVVVRRPKVTYPSRSVVTYPSRISKATVTYPRQTVVSYPKVTREKSTREYPMILRSKSTARYPVITGGRSVTSYPGSVRTSVSYPSQPRIVNVNRAVKSSSVMYPEFSGFEGGYSEETEEFEDDEGYDVVEGGYGSGGVSESAVFGEYSLDNSGGFSGGLSGGFDELSSRSSGSGKSVYVDGYYDSDGRWVAAHYDSYQEYLRHHAKK